MEFIHLLDMLVQTAMMYAGAMETGTERRVDIVGLRQMIDLISVLEAKTKGNLTEQEQAILTNTMFQLRMTYMEIVNMIERQAMQKTRAHRELRASEERHSDSAGQRYFDGRAHALDAIAKSAARPIRGTGAPGPR